MVIAEALGQALVVEPYVDTVVVAGGLLRRADDPVATELLEKVVAGTAVVALAATESGSGDDWQRVSTVAERDGGDWVLRGLEDRRDERADRHSSSSDRPYGWRDFAVSRRRRLGRQSKPITTEPSTIAAPPILCSTVSRGMLLGGEGQASESLAQARDEGAAAVCSEAVGLMRKVLADTIEYCKQRQQFGQPIGSFQVLQHRMVDMYMEVEQAVAAVYLAVLNLEAFT